MKRDELERIRCEGMERFGFGVGAMKRIKVCTFCAAAVAAAEENCIECGARLPAQTLYEVYRARHKTCIRCERVVADEAEFCPNCGAHLGK